MISQHAILCKKTGMVLGVKLDGGTCACPSADECREVQREETLAEFLERTCDGEEARREVMQKFEQTFREVTETMRKARDMIVRLLGERETTIATERTRCATLVQIYGVEQDFPFVDIIQKIWRGDDAGDGT